MSRDQFTAYAVEYIKASITESESQGNKYDDRMRDDYIPPNRKMMLLCKRIHKWIAAKEHERRSIAVINVMKKNRLATIIIICAGLRRINHISAKSNVKDLPSREI